MAPNLESAAERIKSGVRSAGSIRIWGVNVFRPGDCVYQVAGGNLTVQSAVRIRWDGKEKDPPAKGTTAPALFVGD